MICAVLGYQAVITVPDKTSLEKINTMKAFGAKVIICKKVEPDSPEHYNNKAEILSKADKGSLFFNQYGSDENVQAHYQTTAVEIWQQTQGRIDYLVAAASSGGTITGVAKYLKAKNPNIKMILPDPIGSIFYSHFHHVDYHKQSYQVEGAGKDRVCTIHDFRYIEMVSTKAQRKSDGKTGKQIKRFVNVQSQKY